MMVVQNRAAEYLLGRVARKEVLGSHMIDRQRCRLQLSKHVLHFGRVVRIDDHVALLQTKLLNKAECVLGAAHSHQYQPCQLPDLCYHLAVADSSAHLSSPAGFDVDLDKPWC